jgi:uncharacterized protein
MKILQKICFVLLLGTFSSVYGGDCFKDKDAIDCMMKAEQGDSGAQYNLGLMYAKGEGVIQDYKEAVKWYRLAADQGFFYAQNNLGLMYEHGQGVHQDYKEAVKWYRLLAEEGYPIGQLNLGRLYYLGRGVIQNYVMAHMYWNIAAVSGNKLSIEGRELVAKEMTPPQIEKAQDLAREWMMTHQSQIEKAQDLAREWIMTDQ